LRPLTNNKKDELIKTLINKQLKPYGLTYDDIKDQDSDIAYHKKWFEQYTMTDQEAIDFRIWALKEIKSMLRCGVAQSQALFSEFWLNWGLRVAPPLAQRKYKLKKINENQENESGCENRL